jgi:ArsR family transcriptional regulator
MISTPQFFRTLADRTRLRIVNLLARGPLCVCDIQYVIEQPQSSVSRHLGHLRTSGLVRDRRDGMRTFYELTEWEAGLAHGVFETLRRDLKAQPDCHRDLDTLAALKATGEYHQEGSERRSRADARRGMSGLRSAARVNHTIGVANGGARTRSATRDQG